MNKYEKLEAVHVIETIQRLQDRIDERFPGSGLSEVCQRVQALAEDASCRSKAIGSPIRILRSGTILLVALIVMAMITMVMAFQMPETVPNFIEFVQIFEAGINDIILVGAGIFFLVSFERRIKRNRALAYLSDLRAVAHIIDMHQLTKDPVRLSQDWTPSASSPVVKLTPFLMTRYLDYCSEMLALIGKISALYIQYFDDEVVTSAVNEIEQLTTGLSRKIWQKIIIMRSGSV